jgi:hypothetical protein
VARLGHCACCFHPTGSGATDSLNDEPPGLGVQLNFVRQLGLVQEEFRDTDPTGVSDSNDAGLGRHVTTL